MINKLKYIYNQFPKTVWYLTLLQILFVARVTFFANNRTVGDYSIRGGLSSILIPVVLLSSIYIILKNYHYFKQANRVIAKLLLFYLFCLTSLLWAGIHTVIIFKALEVICNIYLMYIIASKINNIRLLLIYIIILSTLTTYMDVFNSMRIFGLGFFHTNSYSMSAMIGFLLGIQAIRYKILKTKEIRLFLILNLLAIIGGTSSATYIAFFIGIILVYSSNKKGFNFIIFSLILVFTIWIYYIFNDIIFDFIFQSKSQADIQTGTGRTRIFNAAINAWKDNPILGHGYIIGERSLGKYGLGINVLSTHNSFLAILVDTGITGMLIFLSFILSWIYNLIKKSKSNIYATIILPTLMASLINCLSFPAIGADWTYVGSLIFLMYIMTNLYINNKNIIKS